MSNKSLWDDLEKLIKEYQDSPKPEQYPVYVSPKNYEWLTKEVEKYYEEE